MNEFVSMNHYHAFQKHISFQLPPAIQLAKNDTGYPHDGRADNAAYRHDRRADKRRYPHDREIDIQMFKI